MKKHFGKLLLLSVAAIVGIAGYKLTHRTPIGVAATPATIYFSPSSASVRPGQTFNITTRVKSTQSFNAAFVGINFDSSALQLTGVSSSSGFPNNNSTPRNQPGHYYAERTKSNGTGDFLFLTYNFKSLKAGSTRLTINSGESKVINYPSGFISFSTNTLAVTSTTPPPPPTPNPSPNPTPTPNPSPSPTPSPTRPYTPNKPAGTPTKTQTSSAGLSIKDLAVKDVGYNSVTITWNTNRDSDSKINFSTDQNDLNDEVKNDTKTKNHSITLSDESLEAGKHYYFRVTSNDGGGPATTDSQFDTKSIPVAIKVTDQQDNVIKDAEVTINEQLRVTNEEGIAEFSLPEGEVIIKAEKDDLSREATVSIEVPGDDAPQQITMTLGETTFTQTADSTDAKKSSVPTWVWLLLILLLGGFAGGFFFWRRKNRQASETGFSADPLEAENYTTPMAIPSSPEPPSTSEASRTPTWTPASIATNEPQYQSLEQAQAPHHTSLPELVGRYGAPMNQTDLPNNTEQSVGGQEIPKHRSLKDLVELPTPVTNSEDLTLPSHELPTSPVDSPEFASKKSETSQDGSLTITHHDG